MAPVARSGWEPARTLRAAVTSATTTTSPASCEPSSRRKIAGAAPPPFPFGAVSMAMGTIRGPRRRITRAEARVPLLVGPVRAGIRVLERRPGQGTPHRRREIRKGARPDRGGEGRAVGRFLLATPRAHGQSVYLRLKPPDEGTSRAAAGQQETPRPESQLVENRDRILERKADRLEDRAGQVGPAVRQAQPEKRAAGPTDRKSTLLTSSHV